MDPHRVSTVRDWPSKVELRRFVWLCDYDRRFVDGYAALAAPLTRLLCGQHTPCRQGLAERQSLDPLKQG